MAKQMSEIEIMSKLRCESRSGDGPGAAAQARNRKGENGMGKQIVSVEDFKNAPRRDEDGNLDPSGAYIMDGATLWPTDCYSEEPCPKCLSGCIFGADFPNGNVHGQCGDCGANWEWDNDLAEWKPE